MSSQEHPMQKIIYRSWEISEVWFFWQTSTFFLFATISYVFFFNYVKVPCKHLGWKVIRQYIFKIYTWLPPAVLAHTEGRFTGRYWSNMKILVQYKKGSKINNIWLWKMRRWKRGKRILQLFIYFVNLAVLRRQHSPVTLIIKDKTLFIFCSLLLVSSYFTYLVSLHNYSLCSLNPSM